MSIECSECKALYWIDEKVVGSRHAPIFNTCCTKGKVKLPAIASPPELLEMLLTEESLQAHDFRKKICMYNSILAFTSMGDKIDERVIGTQGVYNFHIQGEIHHYIDSLIPENQDSPSFSQIYIYDTNDHLQQRQLLMPNLNPTTLAQLQTMLHEVNPYTHIFRRAAHVLQENPIQDLKIVIVKTRYKRQYTIPTALEVAVLMVEDSQEVKPSNCNIILYKKGSGLQCISEIHHSYSPLYYVLLFPYGDPGWHPGIHINNSQAESTSNDSSDYNSKEDISTNDNTTRDYISMMQYYTYRLHL
ncbi:2506_t:CDS:1 [Acaulospora morrowiae]|uniref:2506_t:CDS:1 n=1 Tax=Acaulospora morrowiae TaxID=94023 RepID=A0A9N9IR09_9GLOM|nr:2506_t:CDS:1 [Acaulospora morrowiae]